MIADKALAIERLTELVKQKDPAKKKQQPNTGDRNDNFGDQLR
jgi:hypothetical protein